LKLQLVSLARLGLIFLVSFLAMFWREIVKLLSYKQTQ